jgi:D-lactate dehydrogenase
MFAKIATMKVAVFSTHKFEKQSLMNAAGERHELVFIEAQLTAATTPLAEGCEAVSIFVNDEGSEEVLKKLKSLGVQYLVLRSAGFNHVDLKAAKQLGIKLARVPEYSPYAVAEHTVALMLALNRKLIKAHNRIREANFSLDGLTGFDMHTKTVGIIGAGKIGRVVANILAGFGCHVILADPYEDAEWAAKNNFRYTDVDTLCAESDIVTLHSPLMPETQYIINAARIAKMKRGVMLINTSRGGLVNTKDVIKALKTGHIGYLGLDVYEEEKGLFFHDHSEEILMDDTIARLLTFQNVLITSHQAFLTDTALMNIAQTTAENLDCFEKAVACVNEVMEQG